MALKKKHMIGGGEVGLALLVIGALTAEGVSWDSAPDAPIERIFLCNEH